MTPPPRVVAMRGLLRSIWDLDDEQLLTPVAHDRIVTVVLRALVRELHFARVERASRKRGAS